MASTKKPGSRTPQKPHTKPGGTTPSGKAPSRGHGAVERSEWGTPNDRDRTKATTKATAKKAEQRSRTPVEDETDDVTEETTDEATDEVNEDESEDFERIEDDDESRADKRPTY